MIFQVTYLLRLNIAKGKRSNSNFDGMFCVKKLLLGQGKNLFNGR